MCFSNSDRSDDPPPRPAQIPRNQHSTSSVPTLQPKVSMPQDYAPPPGPPPLHRPQPAGRNDDDLYNVPPPSGPPPRQQHAEEYLPPAGAPPTQRQAEEYLPPAGPPPGQQRAEEYPPPAGAPPTYGLSSNNPFNAANSQTSSRPPHQGQSSNAYEPPPGPPPSHDKPPSQEEEALPPAPDFFSAWKESPTNNASREDADAAVDWCRQFPLRGPIEFKVNDAGTLNAMNTGDLMICRPPTLQGNFHKLEPGVFRVENRGWNDTVLTTYPPLYSVHAHSPLKTYLPKLIYYEVRISERHRGEVALGLGYLAWPYPAFRLPGWNRASLGVHGDDGNRYVNDDMGGMSFTSPFRAGETVGIGMEFARAGDRITVAVFFTRDGVKTGGWDLHEVRDAEYGGVEGIQGLEGYHDLYAAVGFFKPVDFDVVFRPDKWRWQGWKARKA
ncbi:hypothetical protein GGS20DRAFT_543089 [Poronia punctata]|nr:hypothetical protein GGS20DRAFT_543089 [Poronia punctata]